MIKAGWGSLFFLLFPFYLQAGDPFKEATIIQVLNDVKIIPTAAAPRTSRPATLNSQVQAPDIIQTGPKSRCELRFADQTVTRVGSNTSFSMDPSSRGISLQQGSLLFHSPTGKGGGRIQTAAATAAVTGTTIVVTATSNGGFKVMVFEGTANVQTRAGISMDVRAGQLTFILPGRLDPTTPIEFDLSQAVLGSGLIQGFREELPSKEKIDDSVKKQQDDIAAGRAESTNLLVADANEVGPRFIVEPSILADTLFSDNGAIEALKQQFANDRYISNQSYLDEALTRAKGSALKAAVTANGGSTELPSSSDVAGVFGRDLTLYASSMDLSAASDVSSFGFIAAQKLYLPYSFTIMGGPSDLHFEGNDIVVGSGLNFTFPNASTVTFSASAYSTSMVGTTFNLSGGTLNIKAGSGSLYIQDPTLNMPNSQITLRAPDVQLVWSSYGTATFGSLAMYGDGNAVINGGTATYFPSTSYTRMEADTIRISSIYFNSGATGDFYTTTGNWFTSGSHPGALTIISSYYGASPITGSGSAGNIPGTSLNSYAR